MRSLPSHWRQALERPSTHVAARRCWFVGGSQMRLLPVSACPVVLRNAASGCQLVGEQDDVSGAEGAGLLPTGQEANEAREVMGVDDVACRVHERRLEEHACRHIQVVASTHKRQRQREFASSGSLRGILRI